MSSSYKMFLLEISHELTSEERQELIYGFDIPKGRAEKITSVIDLLKYLEEVALLKKGKYDELRTAMRTIKRLDLVEKIDDYIKRENNYGTQETTPSQSSNIPSSVLSERQVQTCFEKDGYAMNVVGGGTHSTSNNVNLVELKYGNKFHLNVNNMNDIGCSVNIQFSRHDGTKQERHDVRIEKHQNNVTISASATEEFVFQGVESSGLLGQEYIQVTLHLDSAIYFQIRKFNGDCQTLSEIMSVHVPQANGTKVHEVLERLKMKYPDMAGLYMYLYNGKKVLKAEDALSFPSNEHSEKHPLLLLKQSEKIAIKQSNNIQIKHIDVDPLQCSLEVIRQLVVTLFNSGQNYDFKVDGINTTVVDYMDCFKGRFIEALPIEGASTSSYRDVGLSRGASSGETALFETRHRSTSEDNDILDEIMCSFAHVHKQSGPFGEHLPFGLLGKKAGTAFPSIASVTSSDIETSTSVEDKVNPCPDNKVNNVVFTIFLVPERSSGAS